MWPEAASHTDPAAETVANTYPSTDGESHADTTTYDESDTHPAADNESHTAEIESHAFPFAERETVGEDRLACIAMRSVGGRE